MAYRIGALAVLLAGCTPAPPTEPVETEPVEAPAADPEIPPQAPAAPAEVVLMVPVQGQLVALACTGSPMEGGEACDDDVFMGATVQATDGSTLTLGEPSRIICPVDGQQATAFPVQAPPLMPVYFWPGSGKTRWVDASPSPTDKDMAGRAIRGLTVETFGFGIQEEEEERALVTQVLSADLDGDGHSDPIYRVLIPSTQPSQPGHSVLYWGDDLIPISNRSLELNGVVDVLGALVTPHGPVLVITDAWMGGSGVHMLTWGLNRPKLLGEWSCGT